MIRPFFLRNCWFLFVATVVMLWACNNENTQTPNPVKATGAPAVAAGITSGMLDTLMVDSAKFANLPKAKLVFSFVFEANNVLTLHGWSAKDTSGGHKGFDSLPDIKLLKKAASALTYGEGTYFGGVVLGAHEVNKIKMKLTQENAKWVVFAPRLIGNNIFYTIYVGKVNPEKLIAVKTATAPPAPPVEANPSPPKNY
jgi:hypothetical protein